MTEVYRWPKGWNDKPILTIEKGEVFIGQKGWNDEPILTIEGSSIYEARKRDGFFSSGKSIETVDSSVGFFPVTNRLPSLLMVDECLPRLPQCICC